MEIVSLFLRSGGVLLYPRRKYSKQGVANPVYFRLKPVRCDWLLFVRPPISDPRLRELVTSPWWDRMLPHGIRSQSAPQF